MSEQKMVLVPAEMLTDLLTAPEGSPRYARAASFAALVLERAQAEQHDKSAEPPRIEDMAPGTRSCADPNVNRWHCMRNADGNCPLVKCIERGANLDLSTIRDVTPPAAPSIADMAPGTTFTAILQGIEGGTGTRRRTFTRQPDSPYILFESESGGAYFPRDIDPSTIRDVTPPPA